MIIRCSLLHLKALFLLYCKAVGAVWMKGVWKNEERRSGTSPSLWPSKSHAVIEYKTNASIYYLNMLHYHYASPSQYRAHSLSLTYTHTVQTHAQTWQCYPPMQDLMMKCLRTAGQREKQNGRKMESMAQRTWVLPHECLFSCIVFEEEHCSHLRR